MILNYNKIEKGIYVSLASPLQILKWASRTIYNNLYIGNVINPETIDYKTGYPIEKGLFCEKIFGPLNEWSCKCAFIQTTYTSTGFICKFCGSELNSKILRKYRMGCILLKIPVIHPWYWKNNSSIIPLILNINKETLKSLILYKYYNKSKLNIKYLISDSTLNFNINNFNLDIILNITLYIQLYLKELNIVVVLNKTKEYLLNINKLYYFYIIKKLYNLSLFYINKLKLHWLLLDIIPVIPPELRPSIKLSEECYITSNLNNLYTNILVYNNRLKKCTSFKTQVTVAFEIIEKINLHKSIEMLFENKKTTSKNLSLTHTLLGKYGRFRQDLLGKRVDFSSRSVIITGSDLNFSKVGLPITLACSLFKPLLKTILINNNTLKNILNTTTLKYTTLIIRRMLTRLFKHNMVLINRAPTLHRMNIQSFKPYLIEGFAIKLYPLSCVGFNADFDGDQMSIILILTKASRLEIKNINSSDKNILSPATGNIIYKINQGLILGLYNMVCLNSLFNLKSFYYFKTINDVLDAYSHKLLNLKNNIWIKFNIYKNFNILNYYILNNVGRLLLFNYLNSN